jgi:AraC-like DNA-binding protein
MKNDLIIDTLSATLMKMKLKTSAAGAIDASGNWAIEIPEFDGFKLHLILKGESWVTIGGDHKKYHLRAGDCLLMTGGKPCVIARTPSVKKRIKIESLLKIARDGVMTVNGGGDFFSIGTHFQFEGHFPKIVFAHLPTAIHIPEHLDQAAILRWSLERFRAEFFGKNLGRSLILNHLTPIMLLQILRIYLASEKGDNNWLGALSDPKLSRTIEAMHSDYRKSWTLEDLASVAGMSRSGFALNFKKQVGVSPMDYLTHWRMQIACELLKAGDQNVSTVANAVGYESESSFSVAFKKVVKCRPGFYQRTSATEASKLNVATRSH